MPIIERGYTHISNGGISAAIEEETSERSGSHSWSLVLELNSFGVKLGTKIHLINPNQIRYLILILQRTLTRMEAGPNIFDYLVHDQGSVDVTVENGQEALFKWPRPREQATYATEGSPRRDSDGA